MLGTLTPCHRDPYHGYWPKDIYALNENFGTEEDLLSLSDAIHARGMYLMLDIVANHMASPGPFNATDWSSFNPFNSSSYFHAPCFPDYDTPNVTSIQVCMTGDNKVTLADLRTETTTVRQIFGDWIKTTVDKYQVDGLRLDSAKHIESTFWADFLAKAGVFAMAEWLDGDPAAYPAILDTLPGAMNYPYYYWIRRCLGGENDLTELIIGMRKMRGTMKTSTLGTILDNNDQPRWGTITGDMSLTKNAMAFSFLADGFPVVYYGTEQHFSGSFYEPSNRQNLWSSGYKTDTELYRWMRKMNRIRALVIAEDPAFIPYQAEPIYMGNTTTVMVGGSSSSSTATGNGTASGNGTAAANSTTSLITSMAVKKSDVVSMITNLGMGGARSHVTLDASATLYVADKEYVDLISCERFTTASNGSLTFEMGEFPRVFFPAAKVDGRAAQAGDEDTCGAHYVADARPAPSCLVKFNLTATSYQGQNIELLGNVPPLGNGDYHQAISLDSSAYPVWTATVELPPGQEVSFQYLRIDSNSLLEWDGGSKGDAVYTYTVPASCRNREVALVPSNTWSASNAIVLKPRLVRRRYGRYESTFTDYRISPGRG